MLCGKARKSAANFFTLDDLRLLRDFPDEVSLKIQVRKIEEKTGVFSISLYAPTRRAHKESPEPTPCESTLAVEFVLNHTLLVSPI